MIPIYCTTSNKYLHLLPVFCYLFNKNWSSEQQVIILGYDVPKRELPENFKFVSMGVQGTVNEWSTDLRRYFETIPDDYFVWIMDDTFVKRVDLEKVNFLMNNLPEKIAMIGRIDLTNDVQKRPHKVVAAVVEAHPNTNYRLSTQPSIWCKDFLLHYLTPGLDPWQFEKQEARFDGWAIIGMLEPPLKHNEGVRKHNPHELDLNGFPEEDVNFIKTLL